MKSDSIAYANVWKQSPNKNKEVPKNVLSSRKMLKARVAGLLSEEDPNEFAKEFGILMDERLDGGLGYEVDRRFIALYHPGLEDSNFHVTKSKKKKKIGWGLISSPHDNLTMAIFSDEIAKDTKFRFKFIMWALEGWNRHSGVLLK